MKAVGLVALLLVAGCSIPRGYLAGTNPELPFSRAVQTGGVLWVAGHLGLDPETQRAPADPAVEAELMLDAFSGTLEVAGMTMDDLVQVQVFCSDVGLYDVFNNAYAKRFSGSFPARAFIGSGTLLRGARFEIMGVAVRR